MKKFNDFIKHFKDYKKLITNTKLMRVILAGFISSLGSKICYFALLLKVYAMSQGKIQNLGFLAIAEIIPFMIFGAFAGVVVDRFSRKHIMIISDVLSGFITMSVILVGDLKFIYVIAFIASFVNVFRYPAQSSFEPNLVDKEDIALMNSFESSASSMIQIIGSAFGAAIVGFVGVKSSFIIDGISFFLSALIISTIFITETHIEASPEELGNEKVHKKNITKELLEGTSIIFKSKTIKLMTLIDLYLTFAMAMQGTLIYVFLIQSLKMPSAEANKAWGILLSSLGVGAIIGSLVLGVLVKKYKNKFKLFLNVLLFDAVAFTLFIINTYFPLSIIIFAFLGCIGTASVIILNTVIQDTVSDKNRGKVFSTLGMLRSPISIISIFVGTTAAAIITAKNVLLIAAGLELLIAVGVRFTKSYREFDYDLEISDTCIEQGIQIEIGEN
jgi:MFS family permease